MRGDLLVAGAATRGDQYRRYRRQRQRDGDSDTDPYSDFSLPRNAIRSVRPPFYETNIEREELPIVILYFDSGCHFLPGLFLIMNGHLGSSLG